MDHVRGAHYVPWIVKTANMEQFVPPWTVHRQVWTDSLKAAHSAISTDILLFSDLNLSLTHHYRVHKRGLLHVAFRKEVMGSAASAGGSAFGYCVAASLRDGRDVLIGGSGQCGL